MLATLACSPRDSRPRRSPCLEDIRSGCPEPADPQLHSGASLKGKIRTDIASVISPLPESGCVSSGRNAGVQIADRACVVGQRGWLAVRRYVRIDAASSGLGWLPVITRISTNTRVMFGRSAVVGGLEVVLKRPVG